MTIFFFTREMGQSESKVFRKVFLSPIPEIRGCFLEEVRVRQSQVVLSQSHHSVLRDSHKHPCNLTTVYTPGRDPSLTLRAERWVKGD